MNECSLAILDLKMYHKATITKKHHTSIGKDWKKQEIEFQKETQMCVYIYVCVTLLYYEIYFLHPCREKWIIWRGDKIKSQPYYKKI